jgi:YggT family protein
MTYERRVETRTDPGYVAPAGVAPATGQVVETTTVSPSGGELLRRVVTLIFGIIQALLVLRIVLLLLNAREGNDIVQFILNASQPFVSPFIGLFHFPDQLQASGSVLDVAAVAALVGWTILEAIIIWAVNIMRREPV